MTVALEEKTTPRPTSPDLRWEHVNCNLCGGDDTEIYHRERLPYFDRMLDFNIVRCRRCGLVYTNPRLAAHNATYLYATQADPDRIERHARAKAAVFDTALRKITYWQKRLGHPTAPRLLDVGCGSGHFLARARRHGFQVGGLEPVAYLADYARQMHDLPVLNDDLMQVELPPQSYDVITAWDVIEHLSDPLAALRRCARWLRPDGLLALRLPSDIWQKIKGRILHNLLSRNHPAFSPTMHLYFFNEDTFARLARRVSLEVLRTYTTPAEANTHSAALNCLKIVSHALIRTLEIVSPRHLGNLEIYCRKVPQS